MVMSEFPYEDDEKKRQVCIGTPYIPFIDLCEEKKMTIHIILTYGERYCLDPCILAR